MIRCKRWLAAALAAVMAMMVSIPALAAEPAADSFSDFRIDAAAMDFPQETVSIDRYYRDESGTFQVVASGQHECTLNRVTGDASFYIQPKADGVWVTVDYLTDLNSDDTYELLDGENTPVSDFLSPQESSVLLPSAQLQPLSSGQNYLLSAQTLVEGSRKASQDRAESDGPLSLAVGQQAASPVRDFPLCLVKLHRTASNGEEQVQSYYLKIYKQALIPDDVSPLNWFYPSVEFVLSQGYLSSTGNGMFNPNGLVSRAQIAQMLWRMGGSLPASACSFSDVTPNDWYYTAVAWCSSQGLMPGLDDGTFAPDAPLTREELTLTLYRFARFTGASTRGRADLSQFADSAEISSSAQTSMAWAVSNGLLSGYEDNTIRPGAGVSRAQISVILHAYDQRLAKKSY